MILKKIKTQVTALPLFLIVAVVLLSMLAPKVSAIEYGGIGGKPAYPDENNPRTKSIFIFTLEPTQTDSNTVLVVNNTQEEKTLVVYATDSQRSSDGSFACEQYSDTKDGVGSWIKLAKEEVTLASLTNERIDFTITAPENASVGEENGCILVQEKEINESESGVSLSFRTGIRVAVTIPGEQVREIAIGDFTSTVSDENLAIVLSVQNKGNVSVDADVLVKTTGLFNTEYNVISNRYPVLRGETSTYNFEIPRSFWGGIFYVSPEVSYDPSQEAVVGLDTSNPKTVLSAATQVVYVLPQLGAFVVEIIFLIVLCVLLFLLVKRIRKEIGYRKLWIGEYKANENEDITQIAQKYKVDWKEIAKVNKLKPPYTIASGQTLKVPRKN